MYEEPTPLLKQASNKEDDFKHLKQKIIPPYFSWSNHVRRFDNKNKGNSDTEPKQIGVKEVEEDILK
ncbi:hypothetical protein CWI36_0281p0050 [Hamiltosporidium magnivora]|uniref:Uncharacterized protein n=1 Tax=Hamiltosporidium magnivora TaxID=148818 RepID=A0A4Q9LH10_9MICR|nr:hypothetical protein CWI36_0281p0050 [Hamiltosporidium magnivora]